MNIHEYQGKEIFRKFGVPTPRGIPAFSVDEAVKAAEALGGKVWVVKAQIHAGGRGKGGGVKVAKSARRGARPRREDPRHARWSRTRPAPKAARCAACSSRKGRTSRRSSTSAMVVDRVTQRATMMASSEGGMDIEEVAAKTPEKIHRVAIDPMTGLKDAEAEDIARRIGVPRGLDRTGPGPAARACTGCSTRATARSPRSTRSSSPGTARWSPSTRSSTSTPTRSSAIRRSSPTATSTRRTRPRSRPRSST